MAKNCIVGVSCGATCIARQHECIEEFGPVVKNALVRLAQSIQERVDSGDITEETADEVIGKVERDEKSLEKLSKFIQSGKATEQEIEGIAEAVVSVYVSPKQDRNASRTLSYDQLEKINELGLKKFEEAANNSIGKDGKFDPSLPGGMGDLIKEKFIKREISDEAAELAYSLFPQSVKTALNTSGAVAAGKAFNGYDTDGNPTFGAPSKTRGVFLLKRWMEQGGLDPYTGEKIDIRKAEPEHLFSFSEAGKTGVSGDQPNNLLWAAPAPNNLKKDYTFPEFQRIVDKNLSQGREKYTKDVFEPAQKASQETAGAKGNASSDLGKAISAISPEERVQAIKGLVSSYGETGNSPKVRYLFRAAGLSWQFAEKDPNQRVGGRPSHVNRNVPELPTLGAKPSSAILVALAAAPEERRAQITSRLNDLLKARVLTSDEIEQVRENPGLRQELQRRHNEEYATGLEKALKEEVPNIQELL
jgi:hypothetical protein